MIPKYRAWNKHSKKMYPVLELWFKKNNVHPHAGAGALLDTNNNKTVFCNFDVLILMQSIETEDCIGIEDVYEGDICEALYNCTICFDDKPHTLTGSIERSSSGWSFNYGHGSISLADEDLEISIEPLGNIYENPKLLENSNGK